MQEGAVAKPAGGRASPPSRPGGSNQLEGFRMGRNVNIAFNTN